jgi:NADH pyrophosphatase NudC (nudix superfamily)
MGLTKKELVEYVRIAEHNQEVAEEALNQQAENVKDWMPAVRGRWGKCGGDLHSSGYAIYCSVCHKKHFVHKEFSLGGLWDKELFEQPKFCPNCGAKMDGDGNG